MDSSEFYNSSGKLLAYIPSQDSAGKDTTSVFINLDHDDIEFVDNDSDKWMELNTVIASMWKHPRFLLGFKSRERMRRFAATVVKEKLTSVSTDGEVRYTMLQKKWQDSDIVLHDYWYQATLESDELKGMSVMRPSSKN